MVGEFALSDDLYARLDALVKWMRERGVATVETSDVKVVLGQEPAPPPPKPEPLTDAEIMRRMYRAKEQQEALLFASSEGFPESLDDE